MVRISPTGLIPKTPKITSLFGYPTQKYPWNSETNPTQPIPVDFFGLSRVIPTSTHLKFQPLGTRGPRKLATIVFILNPKLYYSRSIVIVIWAMKLCLHFCSLTNNSKKLFIKDFKA